MKFVALRALCAVAVAMGATGAANAQVFWVDWTSGTAGTNGTASGTLNVNGTNVLVGYTGQIQFIQTSGGTNYWNPSAPYISATVPTAPPTPDIIALSVATSRTITFSQAITNPIFAVVSLNGNGYRFNRDFTILSQGTGFWGSGTLSRTNPAAGVFQLNGAGEPHGVIQFQGTFDSVTWDSLSNENWNGFTIGVSGLAVVSAPEPATLGLMSLLLAGTGAVALRRRSCK